tara:strand:+ start:85 stop:603 length:519 start_codon:yes stop_codon:yes gene_type:complete
MAQTSLQGSTVQEKLNRMAVDLIEIELTTTAATHANGDVIAISEEIENAVAVKGGSSIIQSVALLNTDDSVESPALDLVFCVDNTALGTIGSAPSITDANFIDCVQGVVNVSNWLTLKATDNEIATKTNVGLIVKAASDSRSIFVNVINSSGGNYTPSATSSLRLVLGVIKD